MQIDTYYDTVCTIQYDTAIVQHFFLVAHSIVLNVTTLKQQPWGLILVLRATNERVIPRPKVLSIIDELRLGCGVLSLEQFSNDCRK